jgi:hypothetical protein
MRRQVLGLLQILYGTPYQRGWQALRENTVPVSPVLAKAHEHFHDYLVCEALLKVDDADVANALFGEQILERNPHFLINHS